MVVLFGTAHSGRPAATATTVGHLPGENNDTGPIRAATAYACANAKSIAAHTAATCAALHSSAVMRGLSG
jgi:hypothetical protein